MLSGRSQWGLYYTCRSCIYIIEGINARVCRDDMNKFLTGQYDAIHSETWSSRLVTIMLISLQQGIMPIRESCVYYQVYMYVDENIADIPL